MTAPQLRPRLRQPFSPTVLHASRQPLRSKPLSLQPLLSLAARRCCRLPSEGSILWTTCRASPLALDSSAGLGHVLPPGLWHRSSGLQRGPPRLRCQQTSTTVRPAPVLEQLAVLKQPLPPTRWHCRQQQQQQHRCRRQTQTKRRRRRGICAKSCSSFAFCSFSCACGPCAVGCGQTINRTIIFRKRRRKGMGTHGSQPMCRMAHPKWPAWAQLHCASMWHGRCGFFVVETACLGNERDEIQRNCDMKGGEGDLPCVPCASCASCASCAAAACQARVKVQVQVRTGPKHVHVREWLNRLHRSGIISNLSQFTVEECNTN